jgi:putative DNA primase/helicase
LYICEGAATAISIHVSTGEGVVAAIDAGNIPKVVKTIHEKYPDSQIVIAADRDPGCIKFATRAARDVGALIALPPEGKGNGL